MRAAEIAHLLGQPPPTEEQVAVIEAGLEPVLVVAGAGAGKTETMASRVVYLVANGLVESDRVLGLTFTRKAAAELSTRVRARLGQLVAAAGSAVPQLTGAPTISTYNAYAAGIVAEHGLRIGVEPDARLIGEAALWQLVSHVVATTDVELLKAEKSPLYLVKQVASLLGQCGEHRVAPTHVAATVQRWAGRIRGLPADEKGGAAGALKGDLEKSVKAMEYRALLADVVDQVQVHKRERNLVDFTDQVSLAAQLSQDVAVAALERDRFGVVLLDEYQDTSVAQLDLLTGLFGPRGADSVDAEWFSHAVTAVGDPHQSIYGWRGASAGNLESFPEMFALDGRRPARVLSLSTSWRNDERVLDLANTVAAPLRAASRVELPELTARPEADAGTVTISWHETVADEMDWLADDLATRWRAEEAAVEAGADPARRATIAVLCRRRKDFPAAEAALRARGVPVRVVGLGGLLDRPEVGDVVATLQVVADPTRGDALMRLLTGPRWRIGARDLRALSVWAKEMNAAGAAEEGAAESASDAGAATEEMPTELFGDRITSGVEDLGSTGTVEALDALPPADWVSQRGVSFSPEGFRRLARLSGELARLRRRSGVPLAELVGEVERALLLDVELAAWPGVSAGAARAQLDTFAGVAAEFAAGAAAGAAFGGGGTTGGLGSASPGGVGVLAAFLAWLDAAAERERGLNLAEGGDEDAGEDDDRTGLDQAERREVQILTVHAAKGLEWDVVAVPRLVEGGFPHVTVRKDDVTRDSAWAIDAGLLPYALRGDRAHLPVWSVEAHPHLAAQAAALEEFRIEAGAAAVAEERRLAYVAFTRPRHALLLSGAWWHDGINKKRPSRFLIELVEAYPEAIDAVSRQVWDNDGRFDANPVEASPVEGVWPGDPLGERRGAVEGAAQRVRRAMAMDATAADGERTRWSDEVDRLLAERDRALAAPSVALPLHVSASRAVALARDPEGLALSLRRPMPEEPRAGTRRGTAFHAWLQRRLHAEPLVDVDDLPGAADDDGGPDVELEALQRWFEGSEWASRRVVALEADVETPVAGTILRGRIDAVFARDDGGVDIVDWKTGPPPRREALRAAAVQLAVYRVAWARLHDLPIEQVHAAFVHVAHDVVLAPADGLDEAALTALLERVPRADDDLASAAPAPRAAGFPHEPDTPAAPRPSASELEPAQRATRPRKRRNDDPDQLSLFDE